MTKVTCGTDIIEIERIKESIESLGKSFLERVYTKREIEYCESKKVQKYQHYAARFAAKEAVFKALSPFIKDESKLYWRNFEVINDEKGRPCVNLIGIDIQEQGIESIDLSISHCKLYAIANVNVVSSCNWGRAFFAIFD